MLDRMLLVVMVMAGGAWLASVALASPARVAAPTNPPAVAAPMCTPPPELVQPPADDCTPRGGDCRYSHECCSRICRTIKGVKSCS